MAEIQLSDEDRAFIESKMRTGAYRSAEDVVRAGLRLLDRDDEHIREMIDAADAQVASGDTVRFASAEAVADSIIDRGMRLLNRRS
ncbi:MULTISPECIES: type II toxin-antitoxin system ParD family antitoxin [unclassified Rhizobium]|uniref:type II toxin-antitoxin system ParD family antitoxin n=1 Tax=unclassified Rhizobium TaxID=2613769 RepID=UPI003D2BE220